MGVAVAVPLLPPLQVTGLTEVSTVMKAACVMVVEAESEHPLLSVVVMV